MGEEHTYGSAPITNTQPHQFSLLLRDDDGVFHDLPISSLSSPAEGDAPGLSSQECVQYYIRLYSAGDAPSSWPFTSSRLGTPQACRPVKIRCMFLEMRDFLGSDVGDGTSRMLSSVGGTRGHCAIMGVVRAAAGVCGERPARCLHTTPGASVLPEYLAHLTNFSRYTKSTGDLSSYV